MSRIHRNCQVIQAYFANEPRFEYKRMIASGNYGTAHQIRYIDDDKPDLKEFLVKRAYDTEEAEAALRVERGHLMTMRGSRHIVQIIDIQNNPLANGPPPNIAGEWLVLEWIPNGTLEHFMNNAMDLGIEQLPNRLLWRFFFCLLRACNAMAWPSNGVSEQAEEPKNVPPSTFEHNDLHRGNVLFGDFLADQEHGFSPIMRIIDFGLAGQWAWANGGSHGVPGNLWDIGILMVKLITMDPYAKVKRPGEGEPYLFDFQGERLPTQAHTILEARDGGESLQWLDFAIILLVARCLATDPARRPTLNQLYTMVTYGINKDHTRYPGVDLEQDDRIKKLCQEILLGPPPPPPGAGPPPIIISS
ncbi:kinase-like protein [Annulohypoxylon moriforme]|nr:kinase-like protein [Annulohypoxylon moriforme]